MFLILKIIGILILAVLGILLALILFVLFVPIRYKIDGEKEKEGSLKGKIKFTWLFHIVSLQILAGEEFSFRLRIFGIPLFGKGKKEEEEHTNKETPVLEQKKEELPKTDESKETHGDAASEEKSDIGTSDSLPVVVQEREEPQQKKPSTKEKFKKIRDKLSKIPQRISDFWNKIREAYQKFLSFVESIKQRKVSFSEKKDKFIQVWNDEKNKKGISFLWDITKKLLRHGSPKKWKGYIHFGMENPADTGKILGLISVLGAIIGTLPKIEPDFEEKVLEGKCMVKGRIYVFYLIRLFIQVWRNKEIHGLMDSCNQLKN